MSTSSNVAQDSATTKPPQLRITTWPSGPVEVPGIETFTVEQHRGDLGVWFQLVDRKPDDQEIPPDFYLREPREVNVEDADSLAAFVSAWGRFGDIDNRDVSPWRSYAADIMTRDAEDHGWMIQQQRGPSNLGATRRRLAKRLELPENGDLRLVNPAEVAFRVRMLRKFADHVDRRLQGASVDDLWWVGQGESGWSVFSGHLNAALSVFQVSIDVHGHEPSTAGQQVTGYSAAALQLWNDLETASYRYCDECGLLFTRQRGRSRDYSRTAGVRFHDRACANRYTQREYRKRQKAKGSF